MFSSPDRVRTQWQLAALNAAAALLNLSIFVWNVSRGSWLALANLAAGVFSAYVAYTLYKKIPEVKRQQEQKILAILKGLRP